MPVMPYLYGAFVRRKVEWGTEINNHWLPLNNDSVMQPFVGYEICQKSKKFYSFPGQLVNNNFNSGILPVTTTAKYPGQHLLANPYTAAIDISQIDFGSGMDNSVFLYNTGSFDAWLGASSSSGTAPGTYVVIPRFLAGVGELPRQVPSMNTMLVKVNTPGTNAYVNINYNAATMRNSEMQRIKSGFSNNENELDSYLANLQIVIEGRNSGDKLWLFSSDKFSKAHDNGYDGSKVLMAGKRVQIFVPGQDDFYQVYAVDNMDNTTISIIPGEETMLNMKFLHQNTDLKYTKVYLHDLFTNKITDISDDGSAYSFTSKSGNQPVNRFRILTSVNSYDNDDLRFSIQKTADMLYIHNISVVAGKVYLYDTAGKLIGNRVLNAMSMAPFRVDVSGVYVLKIMYPDETFTRKIVFDKH
jgi:hypothetical protein